MATVHRVRPPRIGTTFKRLIIAVINARGRGWAL